MLPADQRDAGRRRRQAVPELCLVALRERGLDLELESQGKRQDRLVRTLDERVRRVGRGDELRGTRHPRAVIAAVRREERRQRAGTLPADRQQGVHVVEPVDVFDEDDALHDARSESLDHARA